MMNTNMLSISRAIAFAIATCVAYTLAAPTMAAPILRTPSGLVPGDTFRYVFATTDTRDAGADVLWVYDEFVTEQAEGATYQGSLISWEVIGSVTNFGVPTHAKDHIGINPGISGVYLVDGTKVAIDDDSTGLWSGNLLAPINRDIHGDEMFGNAFTGTYLNGEAALSNSLGQFGPYLGSVIQTGSQWTQIGTDFFYRSYKFYGISEVLTVPVPEPSAITFLMICTSVAVMIRQH